MGFSGCLGAKSGHRGLWRQHNEIESGIILVYKGVAVDLLDICLVLLY